MSRIKAAFGELTLEEFEEKRERVLNNLRDLEMYEFIKRFDEEAQELHMIWCRVFNVTDTSVVHMDNLIDWLENYK